MSFDAAAPGTAVDVWDRDGRVSGVPRLDLSGVTEVLVVAAHPDDETLGCGGLIAECVRRGIRVQVVIVTAGAASHDRADIAQVRADEARRALGSVELTMLGYPDGATRENATAIESELATIIGALSPDALVAAPWRGDGHRDHRVVGEAVAHRVAGRQLLEYPIWMWHWSTPADISWDDLVGLDIDTAAKEAAIAEYESQLGSVLRPDFVAHFSRDVEVYFASTALDSGYFDRLYAKNDDPWRLATRWYEERKRAITMASLPTRRFARGLEIGSSIGLLTQLIAERCDDLLALDISAAAVESARSRVPSTVEVRQADAAAAFPDGQFDLIVLSEIGYYFDAATLDHLLGSIEGALAPGGTLIACHWRHPVDDYPLSGDAVHRMVAVRLPFERIASHVERDFLLDVYCLDPRSIAEREGLA